METRIKTRIFLLLSVLFLTPALALTQSPKVDVERQDALDLLKSLARSLKSEPDKLAAARLQARIADELWTFDEPFARDAFRWSFEAVLQPRRRSARSLVAIQQSRVAREDPRTVGGEGLVE